MQIRQNRRDFLASLSAAAAAGVIGPRRIARRRGRRWRRPRSASTTSPGICIAPQYIAGELLRAEGFTDVSYVSDDGAARR